MSIAEKQRFIKNVETNMRNTLTIEEMEKLVKILNDELGMYNLDNIPSKTSDGTKDEYLEAFLSAKMLEGRSIKTVERYKYIINKLFNNVQVPIKEITVFHIRQYLQKRKNMGVSDRTLEGERTIFCSFFGWLHKEGLLNINPCGNLAPIHAPKIVRLPFTDVEIEKLKASCTSDRDRAIIFFLLATGCRISEVCALNRNNIDFKHGECIVYGKGAKERVVYIKDVATMYLKKYLSQRTDDYPALFIGKGTQRITPHGVRKMLCTVASKSGVAHVHPHKFRRTLATSLIAHGMPIQEVAAILGHDKLDTTMKYVYLNKDDIHNSYRKFA